MRARGNLADQCGEFLRNPPQDEERTVYIDEVICATVKPILTQGRTRCTRQTCFSVGSKTAIKEVPTSFCGTTSH